MRYHLVVAFCINILPVYSTRCYDICLKTENTESFSKAQFMGFFKKLAYANGFPFGLPLAYLLACLWPAFWPTRGPTLWHTCCVSWKGTCYSTEGHVIGSPTLSLPTAAADHWKIFGICGLCLFMYM